MIRVKNKCSFDPNHGKGTNVLVVFCLKVGRFGAVFSPFFSLNTIRLQNGKKRQNRLYGFGARSKSAILAFLRLGP